MVRRRAACCLRRAKLLQCLQGKGEIRGNARRHYDREDRKMRVAVATDRGAEWNRSFRAALYQAARHNVSTRRGGHQDRIRRRNQGRYIFGSD